MSEEYIARKVGEFPAAEALAADDVLFIEQGGRSRKLSGALLQAFCRAAVKLLVERAETAAETAEAAKDAVEAMEVTASTLDTGEPATVTKELKDGKFVISFGLPMGATGETGNAIKSIERTKGNGTAGTADTYTITMTDGSTTTFDVYNGQDGTVTFDSLTDEQKAELKGPKGDKGDMPVKGEDYFTDEDKEEIVNDVLDALPVAEEASV